MKKGALSSLIFALLLLLSGCVKEPTTQKIEELSNTVIQLGISMPTQKETRLSLQENSVGDIEAKWREGDKISLCFQSLEGSVVRTVNNIVVEEIAEEGKRGKFTIEIPNGISGKFNLFAIYGAYFSEKESALIKMPNPTVGFGNLDEIEEGMVMICSLRGIEGGTSIDLSFSHLGSIIGIWLFNSSENDLTLSSLSLDNNLYNWYNTLSEEGEESSNLIDGLLVGGNSDGKLLFFEDQNIKLYAGESRKFYRWIVPIGEVATQNKLALKIDGTPIADSIPLRVIDPGNYYRLKLIFDENGWSVAERSEATIHIGELYSLPNGGVRAQINLFNEGSSPVTVRGLCWSSSPSPTIANNKTVDGTGYGYFTTIVDELLEGETYYFRAYATNSEGTFYSNSVSLNTKYHLDGSYSIYQNNLLGTYPNEIIFIGDGYTKEDYRYGAKFDRDVEAGVEALFSVEPFLTYRDYFKIYKVVGYSQEEGATLPNDGIYRNTLFSSEFPASGTHLTTDTQKVFQYASIIPGMAERLPNVPIILMVNWDKYGGYTYSQIEGAGDTRAIAICPTSTSEKIGLNYTNFTNLVVHEGGGHAFGRLADEYVTAGGSGLPISQAYINRYLEGLQYGFRPNIDLTGDPNEVKWKHFINREGYADVTTIEGAFVYSYGVWKPEVNSCMYNNIPYYNAPSREHIVKRILRSAAGVRISDYLDGVVTPIPNDPFNFETFLYSDVTKSYNGERKPTIQISTITEVAQNSAKVEGRVTSDGGLPIVSRGVCWSRDRAPSLNDHVVETSGGVGEFSISLENLEADRVYYIRAFATNSLGTTYGKVTTFVTLASSTYGGKILMPNLPGTDL
ncbi:MAG: M64 family metallopeptidase [Bacteroidales bacterium]